MAHLPLNKRGVMTDSQMLGCEILACSIAIILAIRLATNQICDALATHGHIDEMIGWVNQVLATQHKPHNDMEVARLMDKGHRIVQHFESRK
jgi:hypothetical protein